MSKQDKFFTKVNLFTNDTRITAINIIGTTLITGDEKGVINTYEINDKKGLVSLSKTNLKSKIDKILIPPNRKIAFILCGGEITFFNLPSLSYFKTLIKDKNSADIFINIDDPKCDNMLLVVNKKKRIKVYDFEYSSGNAVLNEQKTKDTIQIEDLPNCAVWTTKNNFIYSTSLKTLWLDLNTGKSTLVEFERTVQIINLEDKIALSNTEMTLFMKDGGAFQFNPITHVVYGGIDFQGFSMFKNHLIALYKNAVHIYKKGEQNYDFVESIDFGGDGSGRFLVTSNYKVIIVTEVGNKFNILEFQERPYEEQIKVLIDQKLYDNGMEKLIENVPEEAEDKAKKIENFFLDCAWACIEGASKDYNKAIKYISLTDFNPFEFMYMFFDSLSVNIIHEDKKQEIIDHRKENQLLGLNPQKNEEEKAYSFLSDILIMKRNYIGKNKKPSAEYETQKITFASSSRAKINLGNSTTEITIRTAKNSINSTLIKCLIKLNKDPREIVSALDNESINFEIFKSFENDQFFLDEKNKNLDATKFTLAYIREKNNEFDYALKEWEKFGNSNDEKFANIGRERTKKIFYKFKESKSFDRSNKEKLLRQYIKWLLAKFPNEAFEVIIQTDIISNKTFMEEIIPDAEKENNESNLKEKFLEYCNENQQSENYQTQLLQLYADKLFSFHARDQNPGKLEGEPKKYHDAFMKIIQSPKSCYNKRAVLEYIEKSWLKEPRKYLYSQLKEHEKALNELFKEARSTLSFEELEKYCEQNTESKPDIFQNFYQLLSEVVNNDCQKNIDKDLETIKTMNQKMDETKPEYKYITETERTEYQQTIEECKKEIEKLESLKKPYEQEMLRILKKFGSINNIDPMFALNFANDYWNICESNEFFNYLQNIVREYTVEGNKYKIAKNLSEMGLVYKEKEAYEFKKKYVTIDTEKTCDLCKKKIGNTIFVVYPNLRVYHSKCASNHNIDPMTGVDFSKKKYVE